MGRKAREYLDHYERREPWFCWVSFGGPHEPWDAPEPYASAFKKPTFFIIDRTGRIENILIGPQSIAALRTAAKRNP